MATSDEQRERFEAWWKTQPHSTLRYGAGDYEYIAEKSWQACADQQVPQVRADDYLIPDPDMRSIDGYECYSVVLVDQIVRAALAANPQQSNESGAGGGSSEIRKASITARDATQGGEHERSAYNREDAAVVSSAAPTPLSPNPQQIASETKGGPAWGEEP